MADRRLHPLPQPLPLHGPLWTPLEHEHGAQSLTYCALWSSNLYTKMGTWIIWLSTSNSGCPPQKSGSLSRSQYLQADSTSSQLKAEGCTHQRILSAWSRWQCLQGPTSTPGPDRAQHSTIALLSKPGTATLQAARSTCRQSAHQHRTVTKGTWVLLQLPVPAGKKPARHAAPAIIKYKRTSSKTRGQCTRGTWVVLPLPVPAGTTPSDMKHQLLARAEGSALDGHVCCCRCQGLLGQNLSDKLYQLS